MSATHVLVSLFGEIALLLWGVQTVRQGVLGSFGSDLRERLARGLNHPLQAIAAGLGVTAVLQSSTATAFMVTSLAADGVIALAPALAVMLGANIGTALVVQLLSFDVSWLFALLIGAGFVTTRRSRSARGRDIGRILVGIGLTLLSLRLLDQTVQPISAEPVMRDLLLAITADPLLNIMLAALFTWLAHSSIVTTLLVSALAGVGAISMPAALAMVLGANLGSALNPILQGDRSNLATLRLPLGNVMTRLVGLVVAMPLIPLTVGLANDAGLSATTAVVAYHLAFNTIVALAFLPLLPRMAAWLTRRLPAAEQPTEAGCPRYLDESSMHSPAVALANASREALRMADVVDTMLRGTFEVLRTDDRDKVNMITAMDDQLDRLHAAVTYYASAVGAAQELDQVDTRRVSEILVFAVNLEHIGDVIEKSLMALASKRIDLRIKFPAAVLSEIDEIQQLLTRDLQLAITTFISADERSARDLIHDKDRMRALERSAAARQFDLIRKGDRLSVQAGALVLDVFRDLKRIESHLAATTYAVLEAVGGLQESRLMK
ncbi:Na/Pi cotransporter family protein [Pigmentiphaga aceris]|nr:Na/Pi cotransporter family protein [Pigmentiphaga aceris]